MGRLTTHVLDTHGGCPAAGLGVSLWRLDGSGGDQPLLTLTLGDDGRSPGPMLDGTALLPGRYRLVFSVAAYFASRGVVMPNPPFLDEVPIDFGVADPTAHYHVPLLVSPWAYSTYRGS